MPRFEPWDLVKVPFPYTARPIEQRRPALVVAAPQSAGAPDLIWVLMVTSAANRRWTTDVPISAPAASGLAAPSVVRTAKIATIESLHAEKLGTLPVPDRLHVARLLQAALQPVLDRSGT